jgi:hypothetical protein
MRKISIEIAKAFINDKKKTVGNTYTENGEIFLHNNKIAWWESTGKYYSKGSHIDSNSVHLCFSMCGWDTVTTRERLNTLFYELFKNDLSQCKHFVYLKQSKGDQYLYINTTYMEIDPSKVYILREIGDDLFLDEPVALAI